jgi:hypothetical protein
MARGRDRWTRIGPGSIRSAADLREMPFAALEGVVAMGTPSDVYLEPERYSRACLGQISPGRYTAGADARDRP